jgi:molybdenum cofactor cytidylyltransferase
MFRSFAVVPAAGSSARMGAPKLLLPLHGKPLIEHVLAAWVASSVTRTVVVVRRDDKELIDRCRAFSVDLVAATEPPRDMKASVQLALDHLAAEYAPLAIDAWLLAPADIPGLSAWVIDRVLLAYDLQRPQATVATFGGRRGHPLLLPWSWACEVAQLEPDEGINSILERLPVDEVMCDGGSNSYDVDTPTEYVRLLEQLPHVDPANAPDETASPEAVL